VRRRGDDHGEAMGHVKFELATDVHGFVTKLG
jgi:hypothetical protein